ncbi:bacteriohopanetetrol glucosamine biosynthesis glycosyltransferase HpnI [Paraburkholderia acidisoli]|uniref:Glycosyltransferase n=1 Tax=Paraburkholderia acidisoli TaxID=2571748 RepID=A0A7Z2JJA9_9BURK|nr:bacteriohopanetetrol glucosamine biosynthesis glycosyltransferase HpnI [Paraburkholderia acidisoli]QGZ66606.1 glycosyltransferase [Paraburkholderia acidisoli]
MTNIAPKSGLSWSVRAPACLLVLGVSAAWLLRHLVSPHAENLLFDAIAGVFAVAALLGIVYTLLASWLVGRFFARGASVPSRFPGVTVVKPLHGDEWQLAEHLDTFSRQDYPGPIQYLFGVHDATDPALKSVEALRARYPEATITVVADGRLYGPNRKIANLVNMLEHAEHDILCFADSDVRVSRDYLSQVVGALGEPGVGLVTTVYRGLCAPGFWSQVGAAMTDYHFLPGVITGVAIGRARPCFGQTIAMTRDTLTAIGGLEQFAHHLAEDHAMGEAVRRSGVKVAIPPMVVQHACVEDTFAKLFTHELRWSRTIRAADRSGHLGAVLMHPVPLALLAAMFSGGAAPMCLLACVALAARMLLVRNIDRATRSPTRGLFNLPLWDILQFVIYLASFCSSGVVWRGIRFSVDGNGMLSPAQEE